MYWLWITSYSRCLKPLGHHDQDPTYRSIPSISSLQFTKAKVLPCMPGINSMQLTKAKVPPCMPLINSIQITKAKVPLCMPGINSIQLTMAKVPPCMSSVSHRQLTKTRVPPYMSSINSIHSHHSRSHIYLYTDWNYNSFVHLYISRYVFPSPYGLISQFKLSTIFTSFFLLFLQAHVQTK